MINCDNQIYPLSINEWKEWFHSSSWTLKWFLWLILLRPFIDIFWFVKKSGFYSPSQIIGVFSFLLASIILLKTMRNLPILQHELFLLIFGIILTINTLLIIWSHLDKQAFGQFIKIIFPIVLFFYLKNEIKSIDCIKGILMTFLVSAIFPYLMLLYEFFFSPLSIVEISANRGGGIRFRGFYADTLNYSAYIIGVFLIFSTYFTSACYKKSNNKLYISLLGFFLIFSLTVLGLIGIGHQTSWCICLFLVFLFYIITIKLSSEKKLRFHFS